MRRIVIYGAAGMAREIRWLMERVNAVRPTWSFAGYVVTDRARLGERDSIEEVVGDEAWLLSQDDDLAVALAIGTPSARRAVAQRLQANLPLDRFPALVDPAAHFDLASCELGAGTVLTAGSVITVNISLGLFSHVGRCATVGHETRIGRW